MPVAITLGTVNSANVISQSWNNVYRVIQDNVSDPSSRSVSWVFSAFPQQRKGTASVYPCIIIESPSLRGQNITMGHSKRVYTWDIPISIYATRMATTEEIANDVIAAMETNKGSIEANGMWQFNVDNVNTFHNLQNSQVIHEKRIMISCEGYI